MKSYVYIVQQDSNGPIKIGKANDIVARIKGMQSGNPYKIELVYKFACMSEREAFTLEKELHDLLSDVRMNTGGGDEWFKKKGLVLLRRYASEVVASSDVRPITNKALKDISINLKCRLFEISSIIDKDINPRFYTDKNGQRKRRAMMKGVDSNI